MLHFPENKGGSDPNAKNVTFFSFEGFPIHIFRTSCTSSKELKFQQYKYYKVLILYSYNIGPNSKELRSIVSTQNLDITIKNTLDIDDLIHMTEKATKYGLLGTWYSGR